MSSKKETGTYIDAMVYVGQTVDVVEEALKGVMSVLSAPHTDEETKRAALAVIKSVSQAPKHNTISNCTFGSK